MKLPPIFVSLSSNEAMRPRAAKIEQAVEADDRFFLGSPGELPFDLRFLLEQECPQCHGEPLPEQPYSGSDPEYEGTMERPLCGLCLGHHGIVRKTMHIELKDFSEDLGSDYLSSILNGHLWEQVLSARELGQPLAVVVLGDDNDVGAAIRKAASRQHGRMDPEKLMEYFRMVEGFEANCIALGVPVWRLKTDPWKRMLLRVRKILQGGDLTGFAPAPADGERQAVGLSILAGRGIGPTKAAAILEKFQLILEPWADDCYLTDCAGIGEKLAMQLFHSKTISVDCCHVCRPPKPKKSRAKAAKLAEVLG